MALFELPKWRISQVMAKLTLSFLVAHLCHYSLSWALILRFMKTISRSLVMIILLGTWTKCLQLTTILHIILVGHHVRDGSIYFINHSQIRWRFAFALT